MHSGLPRRTSALQVDTSGVTGGRHAIHSDDGVLVLAGCGKRFADGRGVGSYRHQVVALIALDDLSDQTRKNIVAIMQQAPPEAGLASLFPTDGRPLGARERDFIRGPRRGLCQGVVPPG